MGEEVTEVPPPEERLCKKHGKPIMPGRWKKGCRTSGCSKCQKERDRSPEAIVRRTKKYDETFISCTRHPERRCSRARYVANRFRRCRSCINRDGSSPHGGKRADYQQHKKRYKKQRSVKQALNAPAQHRWGRPAGLDLFSRIIGERL